MVCCLHGEAVKEIVVVVVAVHHEEQPCVRGGELLLFGVVHALCVVLYSSVYKPLPGVTPMLEVGFGRIDAEYTRVQYVRGCRL